VFSDGWLVPAVLVVMRVTDMMNYCLGDLSRNQPITHGRTCEELIFHKEMEFFGFGLKQLANSFEHAFNNT